jgi:large subunit ribosomal protein L21
MYAVVSTGGKQLKVEKGTEAVIEKLEAAVGDTVTFDVLFVADGDDVVVDADALASATVTAEVVEHFKADKQVVFKFKKRKGYKRLKGHRQDQTRVVVTDVALAGGSKPKAKPAAKDEAPAQKPAEKPAPVEKAEKPASTEEAAPKAAKSPEPVAAGVAEEIAQCKAVKADGERCSNKAKEGSEYCGVHAKKYDK